MLTFKIFLLLTLAAYTTCSGRNEGNKKGKFRKMNELRKLICGYNINTDDNDEESNRKSTGKDSNKSIRDKCSGFEVGSKLDNPRVSREFNKTNRGKIITPAGFSHESGSELIDIGVYENNETSEELEKYLTASSSRRESGSSFRMEPKLSSITETSEENSDEHYFGRPDDLRGSRGPNKTELGIIQPATRSKRELDSTLKQNMEYDLDDIIEDGRDSDFYTIIPSERNEYIKQTESSRFQLNPNNFDESTVTGNWMINRNNRGNVNPVRTKDDYLPVEDCKQM